MPIHLSTHQTPKGSTVRVINDRPLGGTKSRGLVGWLSATYPDAEEFVYVGPSGGAGFAALAKAVSSLGRRTTLFLCGRVNERVNASRRLPRVRIYVNFRDLSMARRKCANYLADRNRHSPGSVIEIPFGVASEGYIASLAANISKDVTEKRVRPPQRVWMAGGSGTVLAALKLVWPEADYVVVEVGKFISGWGLVEPPGEVWRQDPLNIPRAQGERVTTYHHPLKFHEDAVVRPPYPSLANYDAKVWEYVCHHLDPADPGDELIWNVY